MPELIQIWRINHITNHSICFFVDADYQTVMIGPDGKPMHPAAGENTYHDESYYDDMDY